MESQYWHGRIYYWLQGNFFIIEKKWGGRNEFFGIDDKQILVWQYLVFETQWKRGLG